MPEMRFVRKSAPIGSVIFYRNPRKGDYNRRLRFLQPVDYSDDGSPYIYNKAGTQIFKSLRFSNISKQDFINFMDFVVNINGSANEFDMTDYNGLLYKARLINTQEILSAPAAHLRERLDIELMVSPVVPATPSFTRTSSAYLSDGTLISSGNPRYEPCRHGNGILIEQGTTNLFPTDRANNFTSAWTSGSLNGTYTVSIRAGTGQLALSGGATGTVTAGNSLTFAVSNATVTFTPGSGTPVRSQLEALGHATSWQDPAQGARANESCILTNNGIMQYREGTVHFWFKRVSGLPSHASASCLLEWGNTNTTTGGIAIRNISSTPNRISAAFRNKDDASSVLINIDLTPGIVVGQMYFVCLRWESPGLGHITVYDPTNDKVYNNSVNAPNLNGITDTNIGIGLKGNLANMANAAIDHLHFYGRSLPDAEVAAIYQSTSPTVIDEFSSCLLPLDNSLSLSRYMY